MDCNTNVHVPTQVQRAPASASPDNQSQVSSISQPTAANQANIPSEPQCPTWMGAHVPIPRQQPIATYLIHHSEELDLTRGLMLNSGTSASIACNEAHVSGICLAEVPLPVRTNDGPITVPYQVAINALPKLPAWFYDKGMANVICQADIEDHPECNLDYYKVNLTYTVTHLPTGWQIVFHCTPYLHLYMYYPDKSE